jgi:hypothetical protein
VLLPTISSGYVMGNKKRLRVTDENQYNADEIIANVVRPTVGVLNKNKK